MNTPDRLSNTLEGTAYHEAGHAVMAWHFHQYLEDEGVWIDPHQPGVGLTATPGTIYPWESAVMRSIGGAVWDAFRKRVERACMITLAGPLAEVRAAGHWMENLTVLGGGDFDQLQTLLDAGAWDEDRDLLTGFMQTSAASLLEHPDIWAGVESLAAALLERHQLTGDEAMQLLEDAGVPHAEPIAIPLDAFPPDMRAGAEE